MRRRSKAVAERQKTALAAGADAKGVTLADVRISLGEDKHRWPRIPPVRDARVCEMFHRLHPMCWVTGQPAEVHHGAAGSRGKRDHLSLLFALAPEVHSAVNTPDMPLARLLGLKYVCDWPHVDWYYMTLAWGYFLPAPDLEGLQ